MQSIIRLLPFLHRWFRIDDQVASAVVYNDTIETTRLPDGLSIFTAEMYAIMCALTRICRIKGKNFIIFSDSMFSLEAVDGFKLELHSSH